MFDTPQLLQIFFLSAAATLLLVNSIPTLKNRFVAYGSRAIPARTKGTDVAIAKDDKSIPGYVEHVLDLLATLQVPHSYFQHFYIISVLSSLFWGVQFISKGRALEFISQNAPHADPSRSMSIDQIALTWSLMSVQGVRRLLESSLLAKSSTSKMWFVHWLLGIAFYLAVGVSVWIEGAGAILSTDSPISSITRSAPSLKTMLSIPLFILASGIQHDCHTYLASLPKYTLPMHPIFQVLVCPHYTAECVIYLSLAIISAPRGAVINKTMFTAFLFVSTNLAVTASMTKEWYERKFGKEAVAKRWKIMPSVY
ncbi:hypothetical protein JMJ35_007328 [Cladonia borealis]|uniref:Polyprenal reductase n=1 Tax=Cladonia borealis TaxID=184061 RepID=A0AA39QX84_9LECA|nr:hypothetical protein JMJ35_007328 [Cladonia borealis]